MIFFLCVFETNLSLKSRKNCFYSLILTFCLLMCDCGLNFFSHLITVCYFFFSSTNTLNVDMFFFLVEFGIAELKIEFVQSESFFSKQKQPNNLKCCVYVSCVLCPLWSSGIKNINWMVLVGNVRLYMCRETSSEIATKTVLFSHVFEYAQFICFMLFFLFFIIIVMIIIIIVISISCSW